MLHFLLLFSIFCLIETSPADNAILTLFWVGVRGFTQEKPSDPEVFRLLGEVKYELKDYEGSVAAYKVSSTVSLLTTSHTNHS